VSTTTDLSTNTTEHLIADIERVIRCRHAASLLREGLGSPVQRRRGRPTRPAAPPAGHHQQRRQSKLAAHGPGTDHVQPRGDDGERSTEHGDHQQYTAAMPTSGSRMHASSQPPKNRPRTGASSPSSCHTEPPMNRAALMQTPILARRCHKGFQSRKRLIGCTATKTRRVLLGCYQAGSLSGTQARGRSSGSGMSSVWKT
jgi:hypothetical protein